MANDADVTTDSTVEQVAEQAAVPEAPAPTTQQRAWAMPKSPITRKQADDAGRAAIRAVTSVARFLAGIARGFATAVTQMWRMVQAVPPAVQLFVAAGTLMLLGVVGAITFHATFGLVCIVVVVPVCAATLGALAHRWYSGLGIDTPRTARTAKPAAPGQDRTAQYVDAKLAQALSSFGTEQHQQAVIALFQAKTAVELTVGTEHDVTSFFDVALRADDYGLKPRIRGGAESTSQFREGNSLAG